MNATVIGRPPTWFWVLAILGLIWELMGVASYLMHVEILPGGAEEMTEAERALMESGPIWVTALFAIAVFSGALGALGLVLRKRWAKLLLVISLIAVVLQFASWLLLTDAIAVIGASVFLMPAIIVIVAIVLVWLASTGVKRGWLT